LSNDNSGLVNIRIVPLHVNLRLARRLEAEPRAKRMRLARGQVEPPQTLQLRARHDPFVVHNEKPRQLAPAGLQSLQGD